MARQKKERIIISDEELNEIGAKQDYYEDRRSKDGFINLSLTPKGASIISDNVDDEIESKQKELLSLKKRKEELSKLEKKLEKKKKKKEKKKKKDKKNKKDKNLPESSRLLLGAIEDYKDKYHKKKKKGDKKFEGVVTSTRKRNGNKDVVSPEEAEEKAKKIKEEREKKDFEKKFEEPITLFRQTIIEVDKTLQEIDELIKETKESRARNKAVMLKDLLSAKGTLFGNKTANARAMGDLQKVRIDLELKKNKESSAASAGTDSTAQSINMMSKLFPQVVAGGKKNIISSDDSDKKKKKDKEKDNDDFLSKKDKKKKKKKYTDDDDNTFDKLAAEMIRNGEIELTPHEANIGMEGKYKVAVRKSYKNHDWEFMAIDNYGNEIKGFKDKHPGVLPKKKGVNLWFDDEKNIAKDRTVDRVYPVIQVAYL